MAFHRTPIDPQPIVKPNKFPAKDLLQRLFLYGYRYSKPKTKTWHSALLYKRQDEILCILFRKNGIDLRHFPQYSDGISIDENNVVSFSGGKLYRNHYHTSSKFHYAIDSLARNFAKGISIANQIPGSTSSPEIEANKIVAPEKNSAAHQKSKRTFRIEGNFF